MKNKAVFYEIPASWEREMERQRGQVGQIHLSVECQQVFIFTNPVTRDKIILQKLGLMETQCQSGKLWVLCSMTPAWPHKSHDFQLLSPGLQMPLFR